MYFSNLSSDVLAPTSISFFLLLIKSNSLIAFKDIIFLISLRALVTSNERSVPPLKNFDSGLFFIIVFNSFIVLGAKYFLFSFLISTFFTLIFLKRLIVFFLIL